jgi:putative tricarboxylic transport membrane protein
MDFITQGFWPAFSLANILALIAGSTIGIIVGVLPGLGPMVGMVVLLPFTFSLEPSVALSLLLGVFCGGYFGGAVPAILLRTPGVPASFVTSFDGFPLTERGEAQTALSAALVGSLAGGLISIVILVILAPVLSHVAASFGPPEYLAAALFGVVLVAVSFRAQFARGVILLGARMSMPSSIAALSAISAGKTRTTFSPAGGTNIPSDCRRLTMSPAGTAGVHWIPCRKPMPRCST